MLLTVILNLDQQTQKHQYNENEPPHGGIYGLLYLWCTIFRLWTILNYLAWIIINRKYERTRFSGGPVTSKIEFIQLAKWN